MDLRDAVQKLVDALGPDGVGGDIADAADVDTRWEDVEEARNRVERLLDKI
jgi:hypothetical protein